jgi:predicted small lipoprotein YifL
MTFLTRSVAVLALVSATLAGCGGNGSDEARPARTSTAKPADGKTISGTGYSIKVPSGWGTPSQGVPGFDPDAFAADLNDKDGFADNINVITDDTVTRYKGDKLEDAVKAGLVGGKAKEVTVKDRVSIDGEEAVQIEAIFSLNGVKYRTKQYVVAHDNTGYVVTLSFSESVAAAKRDTVGESILATWKWKS